MKGWVYLMGKGSGGNSLQGHNNSKGFERGFKECTTTGKNCVILCCSNVESILLFSVIILNVRKCNGNTVPFQSSRHSK